jgi:hypothetical protein
MERVMNELEIDNLPDLTDEPQLRSLLRGAVSEYPPTHVDVARARAAGARALRRRRAIIATLASVALVTLTTGAAVAAPIVLGVDRGAQAAASDTATRTVSPALAVLHLHMSPEWLPPGLGLTNTLASSPAPGLLTAATTTTDLRYQRLTYSYLSVPFRTVEITLYATDSGPSAFGLPGGAPGSPTGPAPYHPLEVPAKLPPSYVPGPSIAGSRSVWGESMLLWNWSPHAIASVQVFGTYAVSNLEIAQQVAAMLRTDVDNPIPMPFTVPAQSNLRLAGAAVDRRNGRSTWTVSFDQAKSSTDPTRQGRFVEVFSDDTKPFQGTVNTRIGGLPAVVEPHDENGASVILMDDHTYQVYAWASGPGDTVSTATDLALSVEFATNPADPSTWPTFPIR